MNKEFTPYEQALALKELDFDEPCFGWFTFGYLRIGTIVENKHVQGEGELLAPLYQQAFRWFREKYKLYSQTPATGVEESDRIFYNNPIYDELDNIVFHSMDQYDTYEEAELECLIKLIEIVKKEPHNDPDKNIQ